MRTRKKRSASKPQTIKKRRQATRKRTTSSDTKSTNTVQRSERPASSVAPREIATTQGQLPPRYAFVKKGNAYLTRKCRELTQNARKTLYTVYKPDTRTQLGIGVPSSLYAHACGLASATRSDRREAVLRNDARVSRLADSTVARLYPHMPEADRKAAVQHGYKKRSGRVGRTGELDDDSRARRVVVAYVRHKWTPYDSILKSLEKDGGDSEDIRRRARALAKDRLEGVLRAWRLGRER